MAYGRASSFYRGNQGEPDDEMSVMDKVKSVIGLPFGLLAEGRDAVQDVFHLPGAQARDRAKAQLATFKNLSPYEKQLLGIQGIEGIDTPSQGGDIGTAKGQPSSLGSNAQDGASQKGFFQWAQNLGRDANQQRMNEIGAAIRTNFALGKFSQQQAQTMLDVARRNLVGTQDEREQNLLRMDYAYGDRDRQLAQGESVARTGASNASAFNQTQQGITHREMRPGMLDEQGAKAREAAAKAQGAYDSNWRDMDRYLHQQQPAGELALGRMEEENKQLQRAGKYIDAEHTAGINKTLAETNKAMGVYGNTSGVASGSQGVREAKTDYDIRAGVNKALTGTGENGIPPITEEEASQRFQIPMKNKTESLFGLDFLWPDSKTLDWENWNPVPSSSSASSAGQAIPLLSQASVPTAQGDGVRTSESPVNPSGQAVNAILRILRTADPAGNEGQQVVRAQELAKILPSLDRSSPTGFAKAAKAAGLSQAETVALWKGNR
jgi:hypothetical protein